MKITEIKLFIANPGEENIDAGGRADRRQRRRHGRGAGVLRRGGRLQARRPRPQLAPCEAS